MKPSFPLIAAFAALLLAGAASAGSRSPTTATTSGAPHAGAGGAPSGPANLANPVRKTKASIDLVCDGKTITLNSGSTTAGACAANGEDAFCHDGNNVTSQASCKSGCIITTANGSCSSKND